MMAGSGPGAADQARTIRKMFGSIAPRYDLLNRLLSCGIDGRWRNEMVAGLPPGPIRLLDLACGTGDVTIAASRARPGARVVGADFALPMLRRAQPKLAKVGLGDWVPLHNASAEDLPYRDGSFDAVTIAFGIRNVVRRERALGEMCRVLRAGGVASILDFSVPPNPVVAAVFGFYFHRVLPLLGGLVSGNREAYAYLPKSVAAFPPRGRFAAMMGRAGFAPVTHRDLTLGVATLYRGVKRVTGDQ